MVATPPPPSGEALAFAAFAVCEVCPHYGPAAAPSANSHVDLGVQIDLVCLGFESVGGTIPISARKASPPDQAPYLAGATWKEHRAIKQSFPLIETTRQIQFSGIVHLLPGCR